jgi:hypothetical protein
MQVKQKFGDLNNTGMEWSNRKRIHSVCACLTCNFLILMLLAELKKYEYCSRATQASLLTPSTFAEQ